MTTKTTRVRNEIIERLSLLLLSSGYKADIRAVLNPVEVRDKGNIPASGNYCVLWTEPGQMLEYSAKKSIRWLQPFAVDMPIKWSTITESDIDQIKLELVSALVGKYAGIITPEIKEVVVAYPQSGNHNAVIQIVINLTYVETLGAIKPES